MSKHNSKLVIRITILGDKGTGKTSKLCIFFVFIRDKLYDKNIFFNNNRFEKIGVA